MTRTRRALAVLASLTLLVAACGDDDDTAATDTPEVTDPADEPTTTAAAADDGGAAVEVASSDLGEILVSDGMTLYIFLPDDGGAPTCYDDCAQAWPPLLSDGDPEVGGDLDAALFATAPRDDGGEQVTVDGWPLYFFANDTAPGDTNGQGVGGNWWVVGPDGQPIQSS